MRIFITGNRGNLGKRIGKLAGLGGHDVFGYDISSDKAQDIRDLDRLIKVMKAAQPEIVIHCAGIPHPKRGGLGAYLSVNVQGSANVFEAADHAGARRVVYLSSTGYYGCDGIGHLEPAYFPIDEAHPVAAMPGRFTGKLSAYDQSKVMVEQALAWYGTQYVFEAVALRLAPANTKAWQYPGDYTWRDYCEDYRVTGDNWKRGCFFSNVHPDFAAKAALLAAEAKGPFWYEPFNITDKYTHGSIDVIEFLEQEYPGVKRTKKIKAHDSLITPAKAMKVLKFKPCEDLE